MLEGTEILTTAQMRAVEQAAMDSGAVTGPALMERAGAAVAGHIRLRWPKPGCVTVLCGPGNNGGDGYVVARLLHRAGWRVQVLGMGSTPGPDAAEMKRRWGELGPIAALDYTSFHDGAASDVYVDAIFGTGLTRPPEGEIAEILAFMGGSGGDWAHFGPRIVAVDCPSGLCMDSGWFIGAPRKPGDFTLRAALTVAFDSPKPGHLLGLGPQVCGELVIADIGLEPWRTTQRPRGPRKVARFPMLTAEWPDFGIGDSRRAGITQQKRADWLTKRDVPGHKFTHGHALILAGGIGQGGAARLAARGALRIGTGLVTICPPKSALIAHAGPPDALMRRAVDDVDGLRELLDDPRITAICLGPGCGVDRAAALLPALLATRRPCVLDADALTALAQIGMDGLHEDCVLTPHAGEFARLFPDLAERLDGPRSPGPIGKMFDPVRMRALAEAAAAYRSALADMRGPLYSKVDAAREAAARCGAVVLLKGPDTVIAAPPPPGPADPNRVHVFTPMPAPAPRSGPEPASEAAPASAPARAQTAPFQPTPNRPPGRAVIHSAFDVPQLATAGSGDVLAGLITGLLARGLQPLNAAATGAWLHAAAARRFGPGLIADDLPEQIPGVLRDLGA